MTDDEYREYLAALASKYLRVGARLADKQADSPGGDPLVRQVEKLSSTARFAAGVSERADNIAVVQALANELRNTDLESVFDAMERSGVFAALDELPEITFGDLRKIVIPPEDLVLLRRAGIEDPEAEITLIIHYCRARIANNCYYPNFPRWSGALEPFSARNVRDAQLALKQAADAIERNVPEAPGAASDKKKRKVFNGIGKILAGTVTGAGNLLLATGIIAAPNSAIAYGTIASSAVAVGAIFQGIGDLRGE